MNCKNRFSSFLSALPIFVAAVMLVSWMLGAPALRAQTTTTGGIAGVVTDPSGASVPGATVTLTDMQRGGNQTTSTNKDGEYRFELLPPGSYTVAVSSTGFKTASTTVAVPVGQISSANFQMELGQAAQSVIVTEAAPLLQVEGGNVASTISEKQAENIPNPGNDLTYMAQIAPGSVMNTAGGGLGNFSSFGISAVSNLFTINGMDDNDPFLSLNNSGATNLTLGQNEVQEVSVVTNGYSGQYAGLAGANVNYVTRSGGNQFHGRATWYWNGSALNANPWFANASGTPRSFVNANQYGGDIGGPIVHDKLFFYFNAEGLYLLIPTSVEAEVPSSAFESAVQTNINSTFGAGSQISKFYSTMFNLYNGAPGVSRATNSIPNGDCDPSFVGFQGFGAGKPCGLSFFSNISNGTHENLQAGRVDWNLATNDRIFMRVQHDLGQQATVTDPINPLFNVGSNQPEWQGQIQETHTFSSSAVNQFVLSGQWYSAIFGVANPSATAAAFPTTVLFNSGQFSDVGGIDFDFPQGRRVSQAQVSDDFSWTRGRQTWKFGVKFRRNWVSNTDYSIFSTGLLVPVTQMSFFLGGTDGNSIMEQAFPTSPEQPFAIYSIGGYVEDDIRMSQNLTLNLSFRLDHPSNPVCFNNCFARPVTQFPGLSTSATTPYNQLMATGLNTMLPGLTTVEPQPRFGFAWQPHIWGMQNTVIRGGVGVFYDAFPGALLDGFSENPPLDPTFTVSGSPTALLSSPSDPASLFAAAAASNSAFQSGFHNGASFASLSAAVPGFSAPSLASSQNNPIVPQYQKWSLGVEHQFGSRTSLSVEYVGNHGIHIYTQNSGINGCDLKGTFPSLPACNAFSGAGVNPSFLEVNYAQSNGISNYNGVTAAFTHRYASGLVQFNYTWSHALDSVSNSGIPADAFSNIAFGATNTSVVFPENPANTKEFNYGNADYDIRHQLTMNYVWELPLKKYLFFGHGPDRLVRGWDVNGDMFLRTALPYTVVNAAQSASLQAGGYGSQSFTVDVFGNQLANGGNSFNCAAEFSGTPQPGRSVCLNPGDFNAATAADQSTFGNIGRNTFRGPNYWNTDFSLMKHTKITERTEVVLGAQFFNVFNHPNFEAPVADVSNPRFGQIINTVSSPTTIFGSVLGANASPRLVQFKLQFMF